MARYIDAKYLGTCETCRHYRRGKCDTWCDHGECYSPDMSKIPEADVAEVKHGGWTLETDEEMPNPMFKLVVCSVCKDKANGTYDYCPNCGAKMGQIPKEN